MVHCKKCEYHLRIIFALCTSNPRTTDHTAFDIKACALHSNRQLMPVHSFGCYHTMTYAIFPRRQPSSTLSCSMVFATVSCWQTWPNLYYSLWQCNRILGRPNRQYSESVGANRHQSSSVGQSEFTQLHDRFISNLHSALVPSIGPVIFVSRL